MKNQEILKRMDELEKRVQVLEEKVVTVMTTKSCSCDAVNIARELADLNKSSNRCLGTTHQ